MLTDDEQTFLAELESTMYVRDDITAYTKRDFCTLICLARRLTAECLLLRKENTRMQKRLDEWADGVRRAIGVLSPFSS